MTQVLQDMFAGTRHRLARAAVACACAAALATPTAARAREPEGPAPSSAETSEVLGEQAQRHVLKAIEHFNNGAYVDSEEEFRRAAFYAPNWRPLHFNLAVLAEAQGKLGTAVHEYRAFRPHGSPDEQLVVDQRIDELGRRKKRISGAYKRQIAMATGSMTLGLGAVGGAAALFALYFKQKQEYEAAGSMSMVDAPKGGMLYAGVYVGIIGLLLAAYSVIPLRNAIKSKRQLDGLALGKARLHWNGGAGVRLRF